MPAPLACELICESKLGFAFKGCFLVTHLFGAVFMNYFFFGCGCPALNYSLLIINYCDLLLCRLLCRNIRRKLPR